MLQHLVVQVLGHIIDLFPRKISIHNKVCNTCIKQTLFGCTSMSIMISVLKNVNKNATGQKIQVTTVPWGQKTKISSLFITFLLLHIPHV